MLFSLGIVAQELDRNKIIEIKNGYEKRREEAFELLRGKPLVKEKVIPPIFSDGSNFSRHYSYSLIDYAFKCFWINEDLKGANDALLENANYYIGYPRAYRDKDSFYWAADELCKIIEFYGKDGTKNAGLIDKDIEERIYLMMFQYSKQQSKISKAEYKQSKTWYVDESENHHIQRFYAAWHFAKFLMKHPKYKSLKYDDGYTASTHYKVWNRYIKEWVRERGRKGLFVEMANDSYGLETLKGVYNFYDFGDPELKKLSESLLDLYWAAWAQEQINSVRAGAKSRVYPYEAAKGETPFQKIAWYYLGTNNINAPYNNLYTLITSGYRMPEEIMDIALNPKDRGDYVIKQRTLGRAEKGFFTPPSYHVLENKGLVRYTYCTPHFMAGSFFCEALPYEDWVMISSQNRWVGVIFDDDVNARIYAECKTGKDNRAYNQFWCVQNKGSMIFQKLDTTICSRGSYEMRLWISKVGLMNRTFKDNWIFLESNGAYVAMKCVGTSYQLQEEERGTWLVGKDMYAPVILEVAKKEDYVSYEDFQNKIIGLKCIIGNKKLDYSSLSGAKLTLPLDYKGLPSIDDKPIETTPSMGMESPFVQSQFNSGIVKIKNGNNEMILDFTK